MTFKISAVIPTYNAEKYIRQCIDSIVDQTLGIENIEVIVVNDNSTDSTLDILEKYNNIKIINNEKNIGSGYSRNVGIKNVTSDYLTFVDSDDFIAPETLEKALKLMKNDNSDMLIYNWKFHQSNEKSIHQPNIVKNEIITDLSQRENLIFSTAVWNRVYHKNLYKYLNFSNLSYDDNDVSVKTLLNSSKISLMKDGLYYYRKNNQNSITNNISLKNTLDLVKSIEKLSNYKESKPLIEKFVEDILFWFYYYNWFENEENQIINNLKMAIKDLNFENEDIQLLQKLDVRFFIPYYKDKKLNASKNAVAKLYVDTGNGFNEIETVEVKYFPSKKNIITFDLSSFDNIKSLRFDPIGNEFVRVHLFNSNFNVKNSNCDNNIEDYFNIFTTLDPWYVLDLDFQNLKELTLEFELHVLNKNELNNLFIDKNNIIKNH